MFRAIIFDFGGVIYQHPKAVIPEVIAGVYNVSLEQATAEYSNYKNDYYTGKISTDKFVAILSDVFRSEKSAEEIKKLWLKYYADLAKSNPGVLKIVKNLRKKCKVYLLSNTTEMSHLHNSKTGIYDYFDNVFMSFQMGVKKPNPDIYQKVILSIGFEPRECIFIDDDEENLEVAKQIGIMPINFNVLTDPPSKLREKLRKLKVII